MVVNQQLKQKGNMENLKELNVGDLEITHQEHENTNLVDEERLNNIIKTKKQIIVFESDVSFSYGGVRDCNDERDKENVVRVATSFAKQKESETGYKLIDFGWKGYTTRRTSGRYEWPDNRRWCRSGGVVSCFAIFEI